MGAGQVVRAIVDAGPLIHLHEAGCLELLEVLAPASAPEEVWREGAGKGHLPEAALHALGLGRVAHPQDLEAFIVAEGLGHLDRGEQECLCLCRRMAVATLLTDDLAARQAAKSLGITPAGSLGVIVRARHVGRVSLDEAERLRHRLHETTTLFVTSAIVDLAMQQLRGRS